jgi:chromosome segregation ATPase
MLKDSVKKLERASREQLLLENESQGAFDHLSGEVATLKEAVGALSQVVDGELKALRDELHALRDEVRGSVVAARKEADAAASAVADSQRSAQALVELSVTQLKESVGRIEGEVREARSQHLELSNQHSAAVARLEAGTENTRVAAAQGLESLSSRVSASEALGGAMKDELDHKLRHEHASLMDWSVEARSELGSLRTDVDASRSVADGAARHASKLADAAMASEAAIDESQAEVKRQGEAIKLIAVSLEQSKKEANGVADKLGERTRALEASLGRREAVHAELSRSVDAQHTQLRDSVRELETVTATLREETTAAKSSMGRQTERLKGIEADVTGLRRESAEAASQGRALKAQLKDCADGLKDQKQKVRRSFDQMETRHEAYDAAAAAFAEALKMENPAAVMLS